MTLSIPLASAVLEPAVRASPLDRPTGGSEDNASALDDLAGLAGDVAGDPRFAVLLANVRHDPGALEELAARSYWHSNGFAKLVLRTADDPEGRKVRLHVWRAAPDDEAPRGETDPHGHRWNFASAVVAGEAFDVVEYDRVDSGGDLYGYYEYDPRWERPLQGGFEVQLRAGETLTRRRGHVYRCGTEVVHTVEPRGRGAAATLVVQGAVVRPSTCVYRREPVPYARPVTLTPDEVVEMIDLVLREL